LFGRIKKQVGRFLVIYAVKEPNAAYGAFISLGFIFFVYKRGDPAGKLILVVF
jgi:hypothetical protein